MGTGAISSESYEVWAKLRCAPTRGGNWTGLSSESTLYFHVQAARYFSD